MESRARLGIAVGIVVLVIVAGAASYFLTRSTSVSLTLPNGGRPFCPGASSGPMGANWTTYHRDGARDGRGAQVAVATPRSAWAGPVLLDGQVYAEPLVCGGTVYVATEQNSVYALNATTGAVLWRSHLGTPVPGSSLPCGDIDPSGITGTPVIDPATSTLYAVGFLAPGKHVLFGLDLGNGTVTSQIPVDPPGAQPTAQQQRGALALANGLVYVPFGGLDGDCAAYHGWVVGVRLGYTAPLLSYQVPTHREGGIWSPAGITVAPNGSLFVATGNGDSNTTFDFGDSVIELSPALTEQDYFAPLNWGQLNVDDTDLGSVAPTLLPNGDVFQIGKAGVGYLLTATHLGGIGGQVAEGTVCGGAFGGTAWLGGSVLVPCVDGLYDVTVAGANFSTVWHSSPFDAGPPIVTGGIVWTIDIGSANLLGLNLTTGQTQYTFPLGSVDHFCTPSAGVGMVYVGAGDRLDAFALS